MSSPELRPTINDPNAMLPLPTHEAGAAQPVEALPTQTPSLEAVGAPTEAIPAGVEEPPMTSEQIAARWGQLQGGWQRFKGVVGGVVGRVRAAAKKEAYDPAVHNRAVQNQLYKHLGKAPVKSFLAENDPRYARYTAGTIGVAERTRELAAEAATAIPYVVALAGVVAIRGFNNLALTKAEADSPLAISAREGAAKRDRKNNQPDAWKKHAARVNRIHEQPRNARERSAAVGHQLNQQKMRQQAESRAKTQQAA